MIKETNLILLTDTDTDMTPELCKQYGYNLIKMPYTINDEEITPYESYEQFDFHSYYELLRKGIMPKTSALSPVKYKEILEPYFKDNKDVLYVHFSKAMSGTFNALNLAYEELKEKYPNRKLYTIDTKGVSINSLPLVKEIGMMYNSGSTINEMLEYGKKEADQWATYFFVDNLNFFRKSGRVKSITAFAGNLIGIKPIICFDQDGMMVSKSKARGTIGAINAILDTIERLNINMKDHEVMFTHTDNIKQMKLLETKFKERFGNDFKFSSSVVNPTIGAHCGPDAVGISFHAIHR